MSFRRDKPRFLPRKAVLECRPSPFDLRNLRSRPCTAPSPTTQITVLPEFVPERSDADEASFWWAYTVEIANQGDVTVQLTARHWKITDGNGKLEEVKGSGVVGEQPILKPGETFRYTSGTNMTTPSGIMTGTYRMVNEKGDVFEAEIPVFSLDSPYARRVLN